MHQIVSLVLRKAPEVQELEAFRYVASRDKVHVVDSCEKRLSIMLKRPVCLTKDDMELTVTIYHIREDRFRTGAHILAKFHVVVDMPLQLLKIRS
jgi:hypothetical protein